VFHEDQDSSSPSWRWERRLKALKDKGLDPHNLNLWITIIYLVLGIVSVALPYAASGFAASSCLWLLSLLVCAAPFLVTIVLVAWFSYPRERFETYWHQVKQEEQAR
jgi:hypothetical protein